MQIRTLTHTLNRQCVKTITFFSPGLNSRPPRKVVRKMPAPPTLPPARPFPPSRRVCLIRPIRWRPSAPRARFEDSAVPLLPRRRLASAPPSPLRRRGLGGIARATASNGILGLVVRPSTLLGSRVVFLVGISSINPLRVFAEKHGSRDVDLATRKRKHHRLQGFRSPTGPIGPLFSWGGPAPPPTQ